MPEAHSENGLDHAPGRDSQCVESALPADTQFADHQPPAAEVVAGAPLATKLVIGEQTLILGEPAMLQAYERLRRYAAPRLPLLLCGESGAGRLTAAQAVHALSPRAGRALISVNCAALGQEAAADFERAVRDADGSTLYLEEVSELPHQLQARLFWLLEGRGRTSDSLGQVGDIRLICSTQRTLKENLHTGRCRPDLYYVLFGTQILLPPLRERLRELPMLAMQLLTEACRHLGRPPMTIAKEAMQLLRTHTWPGNLRELRSVMTYGAARTSESELVRCHLPDELQLSQASAGSESANECELPSAQETTPGQFRPLAEEIRALEQRRMEEALVVAGGVQSRAAILLSMPDKTFREKVKEYGLRLPSRRSRRII